jgi:hypothetical protein
MIAQILAKKPSMSVLQVTFRIRRGIDFSGGPIIAEVLTSSAPDATSVQLSQNAWLGQTQAGSKTFSLSQSALEQVISFNAELPASAKSTAFRLRWTSAGVSGSADTLDITEVQIVSASVPTPFVQPDFRETLAHCELYFEKSYNLMTAPGTPSNAGLNAFYVSSTSIAINNRLSTRFRARKTSAPVVKLYAPSGSVAGYFNDESNNLRSVTPLIVGESGFELSITDSTLVGGIWFHYTADAEV